eukprot:6199047-Pleurochrysis_carterae.AAC.1
MAGPTRATGSELSHPLTIPRAVEEAQAHSGRRRTGRGRQTSAPCRFGGCIGSIPIPLPRDQRTDTRGISHACQTQVTEGRQEGWASVAFGPTSRPNLARGALASSPKAGGPVREPEGDHAMLA